MMFGLNGLEVILALLWVAGIVCAVTMLLRGRRTIGAVVLVAAAVFVPLLGSLVAIVMYVVESRRTHPTYAQVWGK